MRYPKTTPQHSVHLKENLPKALVICGHPRSGTTLLNRLCNSHPDIVMTFEFESFMEINASYKEYIKTLRRNWHQRRIVMLRKRKSRYKARINSAIFLARYLIKLRQYRQEPINLYAILNILHDIFPSASVVGDKTPAYIFNLDRLAKIEGLNRLVIYRDCRDVVRSAMEKSQRDNWGKKGFITATKAALGWIEAIENMEKNVHQIYSVRYEDLISNPKTVLNDLGHWLEIDPSGFRYKMIRTTSVGKYKQGLSTQELKDINAIAGPTMERLGYL